MSRRYLWAHIRVALPMGFQASIIAIGAILVQFALNRLGAQSVAAFSAAQKIDMVATLPMMSFGITMATYVAQNYGARNLERIRRGVLQCNLMSVGFSIAVASANIAWGPELIRLFVGDGEKGSRQPGPDLPEHQCLHVLGAGAPLRLPLHAARAGPEHRAHLRGRHGAVHARPGRHRAGRCLGFTEPAWRAPPPGIGSCVPLAIAYYFTSRKLARSMKQGFPPCREEEPGAVRQAA